TNAETLSWPRFPQAHQVVTRDFHVAGTPSTGHRAARTPRSVTLPRIASLLPWRPSVALTNRSTSFSPPQIHPPTTPPPRPSFHTQASPSGRLNCGNSVPFT